MTIPRHLLAAMLLWAVLMLLATPMAGAQPIRIGELNSYASQPAFLEPYRKGWRLALEEINAAGGVRGRPLEVISRDDGGTPGDAVRVAESLLLQDRAVMLFGTFLSHVGLAVSSFAKHRKVVFLAAEPLTDKLVWEQGNRYTFRLAPSTHMHVAALIPHAAGLRKRRWVLIYPNYEYGQSAVASFKQLLRQVQPDAEFVLELAPPLGKIEAGPVSEAIAQAKPDAIFNALFGVDLAKLVREGRNRGTFTDRPVVSLLSGWPEYLEPLRDDLPEGWFVTGYPVASIQLESHRRFVARYKARWQEEPKQGSLIGYVALSSVAMALKKAAAITSDDLVRAFEGLTLETPIGDIEYRAADHQATLGLYVGSLARRDGKGVMVGGRFTAGGELLPGADAVRAMRPSE